VDIPSIFILRELSMKIKKLNVWRKMWCLSASNIQELTDISNHNCQEYTHLSIYPLSFACTSAPCCRRYSTTDTLLYPAAKWSGVDWRPSISLQFTLWIVHSFCKIPKTKHTSLYIVLTHFKFSHVVIHIYFWKIVLMKKKVYFFIYFYTNPLLFTDCVTRKK